MVAVYHTIDQVPNDARGSTMVLGAFDGLHLGHQALLRLAKSKAPDAPLMLATFEPLPRMYFNPKAEACRLTTPRLRAKAAASYGVDHVVEIGFDAKLVSMSAPDFAIEIIAKALSPAHVVVGHDFAFGKGRAGTPHVLREVLAAFGIGVSIVDPVCDAGGTRVSSSAIRKALHTGEVALANAMLGRLWTIEAIVIDGEKRGRELGWRTANMLLGDQQAPKFGIYVVSASLPDRTLVQGVANFGRTPSTGLREPLLEVHLFDFERDIYGQQLDVAFHAFLRPEAVFQSLEALVDQIAADAADARAWFVSHG